MTGRISKPPRTQRNTAIQAANVFLAAPSNVQASTIATAFNEFNRRNKPAQLLGLPGELRNKIYDLALVSHHKIDVTASGPSQPPLLRVCRQVREEALPIYYTNNFFCLRVVDYNGVALEKFWQVRKLYFDLSKRKLTSNISITRGGNRNWRNFMAWLEAGHSKARSMILPITGSARQDELSQEATLIYNLSEAALNELYDLPWKTAKAIMTRMRPSLIKAHAAWGND